MNTDQDASTSPAETRQPCCLVAEDDAAIGLGLEDALVDAGFGVAGPFVAAAQASAHLERFGRPDVALVDYDLRDGSCEPLVRALAARGVPVLVCSGHRNRPTERAADLRALPWIEKPIGGTDLIAALSRLLDAARLAAAPQPSA